MNSGGAVGGVRSPGDGVGSPGGGVGSPGDGVGSPAGEDAPASPTSPTHTDTEDQTGDEKTINQVIEVQGPVTTYTQHRGV